VESAERILTSRYNSTVVPPCSLLMYPEDRLVNLQNSSFQLYGSPKYQSILRFTRHPGIANMDPVKQEVSATHEEAGDKNGHENFDDLEVPTNRKFLRKLDAVLMPLLALAYLLAYMVGLSSFVAQIQIQQLIQSGRIVITSETLESWAWKLTCTCLLNSTTIP
jgi:hypothetical protein